MLVVIYDGGMSPTRSSGIRMAVWSDGIVLRCIEPETPDAGMVVGEIDPSLVTSVVADMQRAGFFDHARQVMWPPDGAHVRIWARAGKTTRAHGGSDGIHPDWWHASLEAVDRIRPSDTVSVQDVADNGTFRTYQVNKPWHETAWSRWGW